ncbi:MAG: HAMP domain-containing sensor histidine kinase, partial [Melioribacteraceae bacterium]
AEINKAALATNNLLTNLLQWTLAKKNGFSFNPKTESLKDVVTDGISSSLSLVKIKELKLTVNVDEKINVFIDSYSISSVVRNLLTNAIKFSNLRGEIIFDASVANNFVKLSLKDTGLGMDAATVDTLFNENNHSTTKGTNNEKGTGIGISLVKRFVQMNGGTIKVESKLGVGSTFTFSMPLGKKSSNDKNQVVDLPNKNKKPVSTEKIRKIAI